MGQGNCFFPVHEQKEEEGEEVVEEEEEKEDEEKEEEEKEEEEKEEKEEKEITTAMQSFTAMQNSCTHGPRHHVLHFYRKNWRRRRRLKRT